MKEPTVNVKFVQIIHKVAARKLQTPTAYVVNYAKEIQESRVDLALRTG